MFVLEMEYPEVQSSGSSGEVVVRTNDFSEALRVLKQGKANRLDEICHENGVLKIRTWDENRGVWYEF